jgi:hypothetical protein
MALKLTDWSRCSICLEFLEPLGWGKSHYFIAAASIQKFVIKRGCRIPINWLVNKRHREA